MTKMVFSKTLFKK